MEGIKFYRERMLVLVPSRCQAPYTTYHADAVSAGLFTVEDSYSRTEQRCTKAPSESERSLNPEVLQGGSNAGGLENMI
jgi:hypothetical protein